MTLSELYEYLLLGGSVKCDSPQQRNTLARFIQDELVWIVSIAASTPTQPTESMDILHFVMTVSISVSMRN